MGDLSLKGINKYYGSNHVLDDVTLHVPTGQFVVIVGPSGCGKTTLLRAIAGLETIDSGTIEMDGVVVNDMPAASREVAIVFQSYALYPHMTVTENLSFSLELEHLPKDEITSRIDEVFQMLSLGDYAERQPQLFLFDEPLSNLDAALRMNTRIEIANIHRTLGTSIIYVTHDQTEAMTLADTIVVMREGRVEQAGPPLELYNDPVNQFVAGFIGSPMMNFIAAEKLSIAGAAWVGLRPQFLRLVERGPLQAKVIHFERLGSDTHLIADIGEGQTVVARLSGQQEFELGSTVFLDFKRENALLFAENGERVRSI